MEQQRKQGKNPALTEVHVHHHSLPLRSFYNNCQMCHTEHKLRRLHPTRMRKSACDMQSLHIAACKPGQYPLQLLHFDWGFV